MLLSTSTISPGAERMRRHRQRQRDELYWVPLEVPRSVIELLIDQGLITETAALDPKQVGQVILAVAQEKLETHQTTVTRHAAAGRVYRTLRESD